MTAGAPNTPRPAPPVSQNIEGRMAALEDVLSALEGGEILAADAPGGNDDPLPQQAIDALQRVHTELRELLAATST